MRWPTALGRALSAGAAASSVLVAAASAEARESCARTSTTVVLREPAAVCAGAERIVQTARDALCRSSQRDPPDRIEVSLDEGENAAEPVARIEVHYPDGRTTSRELRGTCGPLLEALGIVLSQIVEAVDEDPLETRAPKQPSRDRAQDVSVKQSEVSRLSWTSHAGVATTTGLLPALAARPSLGFSLFARVPFAIELRLDGGPFLPQSPTFIRYLALEGQFSACPGQANLGRWVSVKPCALVALAHVDGATFGIRRSAGGSALVPTLGAAAHGTLELSSRLGVFVEVGVVARLNRASWLVDDSARLYSIETFGAQASAGLVIRLSGTERASPTRPSGHAGLR